METIIITKHWNSWSKLHFALGSEHKAELHPCIDEPSKMYAMLSDETIVPNGNFMEKREVPSVEQMVASMNA